MKNPFVSIPFPRLAGYVSFLLLLPFVLLFSHYNYQGKKIETVEKKFQKTAAAFLETEEKLAHNKALRKMVITKGSFPFEKRFEKLQLMKKEKSAIEALMQKEAFFGDSLLQKRYAFLKGKDNRHTFIEKDSQLKGGLKETLLVLEHPLEIDESDLKEILSLLDEAYPQYLILDFHLQRSLSENGKESYLLNIQVLRRDFL